MAEEYSAAVALSPTLAEWKKEIEAAGRGTVILARIYTDQQQNRIILPADIAQRDILKRYFLNPSFVDEFVQMHGANLNYSGVDGTLHFVLLNMARAAEWGEHEDAVLGHEFGHVWMHAIGYPVPLYEGKGDSCVSIQAGDAVQHVVIRDEVRRRGIDYLSYWTSNLGKMLEALEQAKTSPGTVPVCRAAAQVVLMLDVRLGLSAESWERYDELTTALSKTFPDLLPRVEELYGLIHGQAVRDRRVYFEILKQVLVKMYRAFGQGK